MKKNVIILVIIGLFFTGCNGNNSNGISAQTRSENNWILGRWVGEYIGFDNNWNEVNYNFELVLNNNGTGRSVDSGSTINNNSSHRVLITEDIIFSINGNVLTVFSSDGNNTRGTFTVFRINDQRMVLRYGNVININLNKRN